LEGGWGDEVKQNSYFRLPWKAMHLSGRVMPPFCSSLQSIFACSFVIESFLPGEQQFFSNIFLSPLPTYLICVTTLKTYRGKKPNLGFFLCITLFGGFIQKMEPCAGFSLMYTWVFPEPKNFHGKGEKPSYV